VKTSLAKLKSQSVHESEECCLESCSNSDPEEQPPGKCSISDDLEEEPPGKIATTRYRFFGDIPDSLWNDWKWQFRNRITRLEQLAQFISLSAEEQAQLKLVTMLYPLSTLMIPMTR
jgi:hypothetical protein